MENCENRPIGSCVKNCDRSFETGGNISDSSLLLKDIPLVRHIEGAKNKCVEQISLMDSTLLNDIPFIDDSTEFNTPKCQCDGEPSMECKQSDLVCDDLINFHEDCMESISTKDTCEGLAFKEHGENDRHKSTKSVELTDQQPLLVHEQNVSQKTKSGINCNAKCLTNAQEKIQELHLQIEADSKKIKVLEDTIEVYQKDTKDKELIAKEMKEQLEFQLNEYDVILEEVKSTSLEKENDFQEKLSTMESIHMLNQEEITRLSEALERTNYEQKITQGKMFELEVFLEEIQDKLTKLTDPCFLIVQNELTIHNTSTETTENKAVCVIGKKEQDLQEPFASLVKILAENNPNVTKFYSVLQEFGGQLLENKLPLIDDTFGGEDGDSLEISFDSDSNESQSDGTFHEEMVTCIKKQITKLQRMFLEKMLVILELTRMLKKSHYQLMYSEDKSSKTIKRLTDELKEMKDYNTAEFERFIEKETEYQSKVAALETQQLADHEEIEQLSNDLDSAVNTMMLKDHILTEIRAELNDVITQQADKSILIMELKSALEARDAKLKDLTDDEARRTNDSDEKLAAMTSQLSEFSKALEETQSKFLENDVKFNEKLATAEACLQQKEEEISRLSAALESTKNEMLVKQNHYEEMLFHLKNEVQALSNAIAQKDAALYALKKSVEESNAIQSKFSKEMNQKLEEGELAVKEFSSALEKARQQLLENQVESDNYHSKKEAETAQLSLALEVVKNELKEKEMMLQKIVPDLTREVEDKQKALQEKDNIITELMNTLEDTKQKLSEEAENKKQMLESNLTNQTKEFLQKISSLENELKVKTEAVVHLNETIEEIEQQVQDTFEELQEAKNKISVLEKENGDLQCEKQECHLKMEAKIAQLSLATETAERMAQEIVPNLTREIDGKQKTILEKEEMITELIKSLEELKIKLAKEAEHNKEMLESNLANQAERFSQKVSSLEHQVQNAFEELQDTQNKISILEKENDDLHLEKREYHLKKEAEAAQLSSALEAINNEFKEKESILHERVSDLTREVDEQKLVLEEKENVIAELMKHLEEVKQKLSEENEHNKQMLESNLVNQAKQFAQKVSSLEQQVQDTLQEVKEAKNKISTLEEENSKLKVTCNKLQAGEKILGNIQEEIFKSWEILNGIEIEEDESLLTIVHKMVDQLFFFREQEMSILEMEKKVFKYENLIEELQKNRSEASPELQTKVQDLEKEKMDLLLDKQKYEDEISALKCQIDVSSQEMSSMSEKLNNCSQKLENLMSENEVLKSKLSEAENCVSSACNEKSMLEEKLENAVMIEKDLNSKVQSLADELMFINDQLSEIMDEKNTMLAKQMKSSDNVAQCNSTCEEEKDSSRNKLKRLVNFKEEYTAMRDANKKCERQIRSILEEKEHIQSQIFTMELVNRELKDCVQMSMESKEKLRNEVESLKSVVSEKENLEKCNANLLLQLQEKQSDLNNLQDKLSRCEKENSDLISQMRKLESCTVKDNQDQDALKDELNAKLESISCKEKVYKDELELKDKEINRLQDVVDSLTQKTKQLEFNIEQFQNQLQEKNVNEMKLEDQQCKEKEYQDQLVLKDKEISQLQDTNDSLNQKVIQFESDIRKFQDKLQENNLIEEKAKIEASNADVVKTLEKKIDELQKDKDDAVAKTHLCLTNARKLEKDCSKYKAIIRELQKKCTDESQLKELQKQLQEKDQLIEQKDNENLEVLLKYQTVVEQLHKEKDRTKYFSTLVRVYKKSGQKPPEDQSAQSQPTVSTDNSDDQTKELVHNKGSESDVSSAKKVNPENVDWKDMHKNPFSAGQKTVKRTTVATPSEKLKSALPAPKEYIKHATSKEEPIPVLQEQNREESCKVNETTALNMKSRKRTSSISIPQNRLDKNGHGLDLLKPSTSQDHESGSTSRPAENLGKNHLAKENMFRAPAPKKVRFKW